MLLHWFVAECLLYHSAALRAESAELASINTSANRSAFHFSVINNASLPLNFLALPKVARVYAHTQNQVQPGEKFSCLAALGAYDLHVIVHDGQNDWYQASETTWGLTKEGLSWTISIASGAGVGQLAVGAAAAVTASLTAAAAAPLVITMAATATFWGVAVFSSMACSFLTDVSIDFVRQQLDDMQQNATHEQDLSINEMERGRLELLDLTHKFGAHKDAAVFENGVEYLCCCEEPVNVTDMRCELFRADGPSKTWFSSGCPDIAGDGYKPWWESGRCAVPRSPFQPSALGPDRLVRFSSVVKEGTVRRAFAASFPNLNVDYVVMTMSTAERYFAAMQSEFSEWKIIRGAERRFVIAGGFMNPSKMPLATGDEPWTLIDFMPLQMGEIKPTFGCKISGEDDFWQTQETACRDLCKEASAASCFNSCTEPFKRALDQELQTLRILKAVDVPAGTEVLIVDNRTLLEEASMSSLVPLPEGVDAVLGKRARIVAVDLRRLTATIEVQQETLKLPMEGLQPAEQELPLLSGSKRTLLAAPRFGQCWSTCSEHSWTSTALKGLKKTVTLGGSGLWCYTATAATAELRNSQLPLGSLCLEDDECPNLQTEDAADDAAAMCMDKCS